ncbi:unnamed protein product [Dicrocoelium dendriticum]|nr:unnamed protein product [Dicrocoelium dendriticum]
MSTSALKHTCSSPFELQPGSRDTQTDANFEVRGFSFVLTKSSIGIPSSSSIQVPIAKTTPIARIGVLTYATRSLHCDRHWKSTDEMHCKSHYFIAVQSSLNSMSRLCLLRSSGS